MMITNKFVWFHFPKTAGTTTSKILNTNLLNSDIIIQAHQSSPDKHINLNNFIKNYGEYQHLPFVIGFRKLTNWISSFNRHHLRTIYRYAQHQQVTNDIVKFVEYQSRQGLIINNPKKIMKLKEKHWVPADKIIESWNLYNYLDKIQFIKQEYLFQDLHILIKKYFNIHISNDRYLENQNDTFPPIHYNNKDIEITHGTNPLWSKLEAKIYDSDD